MNKVSDDIVFAQPAQPDGYELRRSFAEDDRGESPEKSGGFH